MSTEEYTNIVNYEEFMSLIDGLGGIRLHEQRKGLIPYQIGETIILRYIGSGRIGYILPGGENGRLEGRFHSNLICPLTQKPGILVASISDKYISLSGRTLIYDATANKTQRREAEDRARESLFPICLQCLLMKICASEVIAVPWEKKRRRYFPGVASNLSLSEVKIFPDSSLEP